MKYIPTKYSHTQNYTNEASLIDVKLHHKYIVSTNIKNAYDESKNTARIFVRVRPPYNVGDVLVGTKEEFVSLFSSSSNLCNYTRLAVLYEKPKPTAVNVTIEEENDIEEVGVLNIIEDSLNNENLISYKGVDIILKPVVNGIIFESILEAEQAIDMALKLKL